jgi:hypothetical protein
VGTALARLLFPHPAIVALALAAQPSHAADLRVYTSGAPGHIVQAVVAASFFTATGCRVSVTVGTVAEVRQMPVVGQINRAAGARRCSTNPISNRNKY